MVAGTTARAKPTGENQLSWFSRTKVMAMVARRSTNPPMPTAKIIVGEIRDAHADGRGPSGPPVTREYPDPERDRDRGDRPGRGAANHLALRLRAVHESSLPYRR